MNVKNLSSLASQQIKLQKHSSSFVQIKPNRKLKIKQKFIKNHTQINEDDHEKMLTFGCPLTSSASNIDLDNNFHIKKSKMKNISEISIKNNNQKIYIGSILRKGQLAKSSNFLSQNSGKIKRNMILKSFSKMQNSNKNQRYQSKSLIKKNREESDIQQKDNNHNKDITDEIKQQKQEIYESIQEIHYKMVIKQQQMKQMQIKLQI